MTKEQMHEFWERVRDCVTQKMITVDPEFGNVEDFAHKELGPTIYETNRGCIQPITAKAGGMSWALMKNEHGLTADLFVTHAWREGVYEFLLKLLHQWPVRARSAWICFLAIPQNSDPGLLVSSAVADTPFHRALSTSKYMLVVPNHSCSIYTRLWCVYEAYVAIQGVQHRDMDIYTPKYPRPRELVIPLVIGCVAGVFGFVFGVACALRVSLCFWSGIRLGPASGLGEVYFTWAVVRVLVRKCELRWRMAEERAWRTRTQHYMERFALLLAFECIGFFFMTFAAGTVIVLLILPDSAPCVSHLGYGERLTCLLLVVTFTISYLCEIFIVTGSHMAEIEASELHFTSVSHAACTSETDKQRISDQIRDKERDINDTINTLRNVGRYNKRVLRNLHLGLSQRLCRQSVNVGRALCALVSYLFWLLTDIACPGGDFALPAALLVLCVAMLCLSYIINSFKELSIFAIEVGFFSGLFYLVVSQWFYEPEASSECRQFTHTLPLFVATSLLMVFLDLLFYCGCAPFSPAFRKTQQTMSDASWRMRTLSGAVPHGLVSDGDIALSFVSSTREPDEEN